MEVWPIAPDGWMSDDEDEDQPQPRLIAGLLPLPDQSPFQDLRLQSMPEMLVSPVPLRSCQQEDTPEVRHRDLPSLADLCSRKMVSLLKSEAQLPCESAVQKPHTTAVAGLSQAARSTLLESLLASCCTSGDQLESLSTSKHQIIDFSEQVLLPATSMAYSLREASEEIVSLKLDGLECLADLLEALGHQVTFPRLVCLSCRDLKLSLSVDKALGRLVRLAPSLASVTFEGARTISGHSGNGVLENTLEALSSLPKLCQVNLGNILGLAWASVCPLLISCPIKLLGLAHCSDLVDDEGIVFIASELNDRLKELDVSGCPKVTDEGLQAVALHCKGLRVLSVKDCFDVTSAGFSHIARECAFLEEIHMDGCFEVDDETLLDLSHHPVHSSLRILTFRDCTRMTGEGIRALATGCPNLRDIDLMHVMSVGADPLECLSANCPNLRYLSYKGPETAVDKELLQETVSRIPGVEVLAIQDAKFVDHNCLSVISTAWSASLRALTLTHCPSLSYGSLRGLSACKQLKAINFSGCGALDNRGLRRLIASAELLETVNLSGVAGVSNKTIEWLAECCLRLKSVNVFGCSKLLPRSLNCLTRHCENLRKLRTGPCQVDDDSLVELGKNCVLMQELLITGGLSLSDMALANALRPLPRLRSLALTDCALLTNESMRTLGTSSPLLTSLLLVACPCLDHGIFQYLRLCKNLSKLFLGEGLGFDPDDSQLAAFISARPLVSVIGPGVNLAPE